MTYRVFCRDTCAFGWHIIYSLICERIQKVVRICAKLLYLQKWHRSEPTVSMHMHTSFTSSATKGILNTIELIKNTLASTTAAKQ